jgi:CRISPR/Cas system CSM-associated protein Csm3 (group 7 of RAMP superfamily)
MNQIEIQFDLITKSAFYIGSGMGIAGVVDNACLKDMDGFVYIPGSSIKGKLRYFCKQLLQMPLFKTSIPVCETLGRPEICMSDTCLICKLFGSSYTEGAFHFSDARLKNEFIATLQKQTPLDMGYQSSLRTNNKINRYTKTTEPGHLFTTEVGERELIFEGNIRGDIKGIQCDDSNNPIPLELILVLSGLNLLNSLGGQRSRGLGNCKVENIIINIDGRQYNRSEILNEDRLFEWELTVVEGKL